MATAGDLVGRVLDVGCGTGEHALMAASLGYEAVGVDIPFASSTWVSSSTRCRLNQ
ncbi:MAG: class I SAM-dependent methyltransferase [Acidimicrobiales bacterium]